MIEVKLRAFVGGTAVTVTAEGLPSRAEVLALHAFRALWEFQRLSERAERPAGPGDVSRETC